MVDRKIELVKRQLKARDRDETSRFQSEVRPKPRRIELQKTIPRILTTSIVIKH